MFDFIQITPQLLRIHARSLEEALMHVERAAAKDALLPAEFMATFADEAVDRDPWIGFWICDQDSGLVIGSGGFKGNPDENGVEIGYGISPDWQSQGVATALVTRMVEFAFEHGLKRVFAHTLPDGHASQKVLGKNGFSLVGPTYVEEDGDVLLFEKVHLG